MLLATYPDGYGDDDIISFKNGNGEIIQAVALQTDDILYLVKIGKNTSHFIAQEALEEENEVESEETGLPDTELELNMEEEADPPGGDTED